MYQVFGGTIIVWNTCLPISHSHICFQSK